MSTPPFGRVLIVGTGLMGTSTGLALRRAGVEVLLSDTSTAHLRLAVSLGAGLPADDDSDPELVIVGVPPAAVGPVVGQALERFPTATVTDLSSVQARALAAVQDQLDQQVGQPVGQQRTPQGMARYVGSHPMAGSERSGPLAAQEHLFDGRAWAVTPHPASAPESIAVVESLVEACGAFPVRMTPAEHDEAVALVSHVPQVAASVVAGLLTTAAEEHLLLAGQGLRDVTRIAAGDAALWTQILSANARPVARLLHEAAEHLQRLAGTLDKLEPEDGSGVHNLLERGAAGVRRLPGKHGARAEPFALVPVLLPDRPGELARLFADVGSAGVNIEDVRIDHSPGVSAGMVELAVLPSALPGLLDALELHGWSVHG